VCVCVCLAVAIEHSKHMCRVILSSVACLAVQHFFSHYLINCTIFFLKRLNIKCFDFSTNLARNISHSKKNAARYHKFTFISM